MLVKSKNSKTLQPKNRNLAKSSETQPNNEEHCLKARCIRMIAKTQK